MPRNMNIIIPQEEQQRRYPDFDLSSDVFREWLVKPKNKVRLKYPEILSKGLQDLIMKPRSVHRIGYENTTDTYFLYWDDGMKSIPIKKDGKIIFDMVMVNCIFSSSKTLLQTFLKEYGDEHYLEVVIMPDDEE